MSHFYASLAVQQAKILPPMDPEVSASEEMPTAAASSGQKGRLLTTGDMARLSSNTVRTVRFYEETGVLEPAHRSEGGHRLFPLSELDKLVFVTAMRNAGLSLEEIKLLLGMKESLNCGAEASGRVVAVLEQHISTMTEKIAVLSKVRSEFQRAASQLGACHSCHDEARFPKHCGDCEVMRGSGVPLAVQVLWQLDAHGDDASKKEPR